MAPAVNNMNERCATNGANTARHSPSKSDVLSSPTQVKALAQIEGTNQLEIDSNGPGPVITDEEYTRRVKNVRQTWLLQDAKIRDSQRNVMSPGPGKVATNSPLTPNLKGTIRIGKPSLKSGSKTRWDSDSSQWKDVLAMTWHAEMEKNNPPNQRRNSVPRSGVPSPSLQSEGGTSHISPELGTRPQNADNMSPAMALARGYYRDDDYWIDEQSLSVAPARSNAPKKFAAMPGLPDLNASTSSFMTELPPVPRRRGYDDESVSNMKPIKNSSHHNVLPPTRETDISRNSNSDDSFGEEKVERAPNVPARAQSPQRESLEHDDDDDEGTMMELVPLKEAPPSRRTSQNEEGKGERDWRNALGNDNLGMGKLVDKVPFKRRWSSKNRDDLPVWPPIIKVHLWEKGEMSGVSLGSGFTDSDSLTDSFGFASTLDDDDFLSGDDFLKRQPPERRTSYRIRYDGPTSLKLCDIYRLPPVPKNDSRFEPASLPADGAPSMPTRRAADTIPSAPSRRSSTEDGDDDVSIGLDEEEEEQKRPDVWITPTPGAEPFESMWRVKRIWAVEEEDAKEQEVSVHKRDLLNQIKTLVGAPTSNGTDTRPNVPTRSWHVQPFVEKRGQLRNVRAEKDLDTDAFAADIEEMAKEAVEENALNKRAMEDQQKKWEELKRERQAAAHESSKKCEAGPAEPSNNSGDPTTEVIPAQVEDRWKVESLPETTLEGTKVEMAVATMPEKTASSKKQQLPTADYMQNSFDLSRSKSHDKMKRTKKPKKHRSAPSRSDGDELRPRSDHRRAKLEGPSTPKRSTKPVDGWHNPLQLSTKKKMPKRQKSPTREKTKPRDTKPADRPRAKQVVAMAALVHDSDSDISSSRAGNNDNKNVLDDDSSSDPSVVEELLPDGPKVSLSAMVHDSSDSDFGLSDDDSSLGPPKSSILVWKQGGTPVRGNSARFKTTTTTNAAIPRSPPLAPPDSRKHSPRAGKKK